MPAASSGRTARPGRARSVAAVALLLGASALVPLAAAAASTPAAPAERPRPPPVVADPPRVPPLWMPVAGPVVRGFDARAGPFGPGHRGIDIVAPVGEVARAPAAGRVVFAGRVAGVTWVSLLVAPGVVVTVGPLLDPAASTAPAAPSAPTAPAPTVASVAGGTVEAHAPLGRVGPGHGAPPNPPVGPGRAAPPSAGAGPDPDVVSAGPRLATLHLSARVDGRNVDPLAYLVDRPRARLAPLAEPGGLAGR